jgi:hypothetical protein
LIDVALAVLIMDIDAGQQVAGGFLVLDWHEFTPLIE